MTWITENAWPAIVLLVGAAVIAWLMVEKHGRIIAAGLISAACVLWFIEDTVVTPAEVVEARVQLMLDAFKAGDESAVHQMISDASPELKKTASRGLQLVALQNSFHLKDLQTTVQPDSKRAVVHLRANGRATLKQNSIDQQVATRWETTWDLIDSQWKLSGVKRLDVVTGKEIGVLDPG